MKSSTVQFSLSVVSKIIHSLPEIILNQFDDFLFLDQTFKSRGSSLVWWSHYLCVNCDFYKPLCIVPNVQNCLYFSFGCLRQKTSSFRQNKIMLVKTFLLFFLTSQLFCVCVCVCVCVFSSQFTVIPEETTCFGAYIKFLIFRLYIICPYCLFWCIQLVVEYENS